MFVNPRRRHNTAPFGYRFSAVALTVVLLTSLIVPQSLLPLMPTVAAAVSTDIVVSQVYGGGGNSGATYKNDFIELFNRGTSAVTVTGWSVQYASATGSSWVKTDLTGTIQPGAYYLVQEGPGTGGTTALPTPEAFGTIAMSATAGKVALLTNQTLLTCGGATNNCFPNAAIKDFVGFGSTANNYEGTGPTPAPSNTNAVIRGGGGCTETDSNAADFTAGAPTPRNSASPTNSCSGGGSTSTNPSGTGAANPNSVGAGASTLLTVTVTPGTNPASTGISVTGNLTPIGGAASQPFYNDGTHGDVTTGDNIFSFQATVPSGTTGGTKSLSTTITDAQSRTGSAAISLTVLAPTNPSGTGTATPSSVAPGGTTLLTVTVTPGTSPASTGLTVSADLSSIGGAASQLFFDDGTNGDVTPGDNKFSFQATVASGTSDGAKSLSVTIRDAQSRTGSSSISLTVQSTSPAQSGIVISQVYGGGGNSGATFKNDYIELFNSGTSPVDVTGWSVQFTTSSTTSWTDANKTTLSGTIAAGHYFLIREAAGAAGTVDLPAADVVGTIAVGSTAGKVALVSNNTLLPDGCPIGNASVVDFIGYGGVTCSEGNAPAPTLTNTTAALRQRCKDTNNNAADFTAVSPNPRNSSTTASTCSGGGGDYAPQVFSTTPASNATGVLAAGNISISFDEPVTASSNSFTISCATSGAHTAVVTGGPGIYTLNPDTDFANNEQCTVTVVAANVTDVDTIDPPDQMASDYIFSFTTAADTSSIHNASEHLVMGNPTNAMTDVNAPLNYLMSKLQYALSYNNDKGTPNWTSWHLDSTWTTGVSDRQNDFRSDDTLPASFKHVSNGYNFATYGFDRGHMTPSADRTSSIVDNSATFLMTNMVPQASGNNQGPWAAMEDYIRTQISGTQNELYILSGGQGVGGNSSTGFWEKIIDTAGNEVTVPKVTWKVVMVLPRADGDDVARVNSSTRTFAVIMPNNDNIRADQWQKYLATVDQVEALTGFDFYSNVSPSIQNVIEARLDAANNTAPVASNQTIAATANTATVITLGASDFNVNNQLTYTVTSAPSHGTLSGTGANLSYTPAFDYTGADSFTFKANDGGLDSNVATVTINVTAPPTYTISGKVTNGNNNGIASITISLSGNGKTASATTDSSGNYSFTALPAGTYTLTPSSSYYTFNPSSQNVTITNSNTTASQFIATANAKETPAGNNVMITEGDVTVTFSNVTTGGTTMITPIDPNSAGSAPQGFTITSPAFEITTTAQYTGTITVGVHVPAVSDEAFPRTSVLHGEGNPQMLVDRTSGRDTAGKIAYATVTSLSPFVIAQNNATPTAAVSAIGGQIVTSDGMPLAGVTLSLSGATTPRRTITDANGMYQFSDMETGGFYVVTPSRANYSFNPSSRSFSLVSNKSDAGFTGVADTRTTTNPLDTDMFFVRQQYLDFLGREPDAGGLEYWSDVIGKCGSDQSCINAARISVSAAFFIEREYQDTGFYAYRLYKTTFGRAPTYLEYKSARAEVVGGQTLATSKRLLAEELIAQPAVKALFDGRSNAEYVDAIFANTHVVPTTEAREALINALKQGTETRAGALQKVAETQEFKDAEYNRAFVIMQYFGYLKRDPDDGGLQFWTDILNNRLPNNYRGMVCAFVSSAEYQLRFSSVVTRSDRDCGK